MFGAVRITLMWVLVAMFVAQSSALLWAQSLGELARQQRQLKGRPQVQGLLVEDETVGLRLTIPDGWKPEALSFQLVINCMPEYLAACRLIVESRVVPKSKTTITEEDRQSWKKRHASPVRVLSSRDLTVAGYPAYEVVVQQTNDPQYRYLHVYILAAEARRSYESEFSAWRDKDYFDDYRPTIEKVVQSFAPIPAPSELADQKALWSSQDERQAFTNTFILATVQMACKEILGKYASVEQMLKGCTSERGSVGLLSENDPNRDPDYEYTWAFHSDTFELSAVPRKSGLGGFFYDGKNFYFNQSGRASRSDQQIPGIAVGDLSGLVADRKPLKVTRLGELTKPEFSVEPTTGAEKKQKVWTNEDLRGLSATRIATGSVQQPTKPSSPPSSSGDWGETPKEQEDRANWYLGTIYWLEWECHWHLKKYCTLNQLIEGVQVAPGQTIGFRLDKDPRANPYYEFVTILSSDYGDIQIVATPRRPGLGGFFYDGKETRYNPAGPASASDKVLPGHIMGNNYALIREHQH